jgi:hypothetical protein
VPTAASKSAASTMAAAAHSAKPKKTADPADTCDNRPAASGDIYVRMLMPGSPWVAQELGGEWRWDVAEKKCLTSVQLMIATAPPGPGQCTQVGYVKDNPGYNPDATPATPLKAIAAETGASC